MSIIFYSRTYLSAAWPRPTLRSTPYHGLVESLLGQDLPPPVVIPSPQSVLKQPPPEMASRGDRNALGRRKEARDKNKSERERAQGRAGQ